MEFTEYQKRSYAAIQDHDDKKDEILNWAIGLSEETGEVMSLFKHCFWGKEDINVEDLAKELGDILWYLNAIATAVGLDLGVIAKLNVGKLEHRFGGQFTDKKSKNRHQRDAKFADSDSYQKLIKQLCIDKQ